MHSIFSPNIINDDRPLFFTGIARLSILSDEASDGLFSPVFVNPNAKSDKAWRLAGTKNPENKKGPVLPKKTFRFFISGHSKQREAIFSRMRLNSIEFYRFYADRSNNSSRVSIARRLFSIWLCPYQSRVILADA